MKKKLVGILVCTLLLIAGFTVSGAINSEKKSLSLQVETIVWSEDFDSYAAGSPLHGQGGWEAWDLYTELSPYVSDEQSRSSPNSVELNYKEDQTWSDIVHMFYGVDSGQWTITAWQFLPEEFSGVSELILLNKYEHNIVHNEQDWSLVLFSDSSVELIYAYGTGDALPLIRNEWIEIRIEIDFEQDTMDIYYNNTQLTSTSWTGGNGQKNLACIDLANDWMASNASYFDDISLEGDVSESPDLYCEGDLRFTGVEPGETVTGSFILQNIGAAGTLLDWEIESTPDWGDWTFNPNGGTDLEAWDPITVNVEIVAPTQKDEYIDELRIVNSEDSSDYCIIPVYLNNPRNRVSFFNIFERLENRFPILSQLIQIFLK